MAISLIHDPQISHIIHRPYKAWMLHLLLIVALFMCSCNKPTSTETAVLRGMINLVNDTGDPVFEPSDYSGVSVELYRVAEYDTTLIRFSYHYNGIGGTVDQASEFDHRLEAVIASAISDQDGNFIIKNIVPGTYNLVASKADWGFRYLYSIQINAGNNDLVSFHKMESEESISSLVLYPERKISGVVHAQISLDPWRHLVLDSDTFFAPGSRLSLAPSSIVRIDPGAKLEIAGEFKAQGGQGAPFWITSNDGFASETKHSDKINARPNSCLMVKILPGAQIDNDHLSNGRISFAKTGLHIAYQAEIGLSHLVVKCEENGLVFEHCQEASVRYSRFASYSTIASFGVYYISSSSGYVERCIFLNNYTGLKLKDDSDPQVSNNLFSMNTYGIEMFSSSSQVSHNSIENCSYGMRICGPRSPTIERNSIHSTTCIYLGFSGYYPSPTPEIHHNNLNSESYYYFVQTTSAANINASHNYYYTTSIEQINTRIRDKGDYPSEVQSTVGIVLFDPILNSPVANAGAQP